MIINVCIVLLVIAIAIVIYLIVAGGEGCASDRLSGRDMLEPFEAYGSDEE